MPVIPPGGPSRHTFDKNGHKRLLMILSLVIVPGNDGQTLAEQTCPHFSDWLDNIVSSRNKDIEVWVFRHDIRIDSLDSWFAYCEAGDDLLGNLASMQGEEELVSTATC